MEPRCELTKEAAEAMDELNLTEEEQVAVASADTSVVHIGNETLIPNPKLNKRKNWMRNRQCVCNSGKKFKKCCWYLYR